MRASTGESKGGQPHSPGTMACWGCPCKRFQGGRPLGWGPGLATYSILLSAEFQKIKDQCVFCKHNQGLGQLFFTLFGDLIVLQTDLDSRAVFISMQHARQLEVCRRRRSNFKGLRLRRIKLPEGTQNSILRSPMRVIDFTFRHIKHSLQKKPTEEN